MSALLLALGASASWGASDFLAGLKSRTGSLLAVLLVSQAAGLLVLLPAAFAWAGERPDGRFLFLALMAGICNVVALAAFYRGMAIGPMGIVCAITACDAIVPVVVSAWTGRPPGAVAFAGTVLALAGLALLSRGAGEQSSDRVGASAGIALALVAALAFGLFTLSIDSASDGGVLWAVFVSRLASVALLWTVAVVHFRGSMPVARQDTRVLVAIGLTDVLATALFATAATQGFIAHVGVLGSLYPVVTIALARVLLREQLDRLQLVGAAGALLGAAVIATAAA